MILSTVSEESQRWSLVLCGPVKIFFPVSWRYYLRAVKEVVEL